MYGRTHSDLTGLDDATLRQWLRDAQRAMHDLMIGGKPVTVKYTQGDGEKSVTYKPADAALLRGYIEELKAQLGITCGRRPLRPYFR